MGEAVRKNATASMIFIAGYFDDVRAAEIVVKLLASGDPVALRCANSFYLRTVTPYLVSAVATHANSTNSEIRQLVVFALKEPNIAKHDFELAIKTIRGLQHDEDLRVSQNADRAVTALKIWQRQHQCPYP